MGKPAVLKAGGSARPVGRQTLCAARPDFQSGSGSWALRAQVASGGQRFRRWITTGNVPVRSIADRANKLIDSNSGFAIFAQ